MIHTLPFLYAYKHFGFTNKPSNFPLNSKNMNRSVYLTLFFFLMPVVTEMSVAQDFSVSCGLTGNRISLDGMLDEPAWSGAGVIRDFREVEPETGTEPSVRTTVRVLSDGKALYLGITCQESDPSNILAFSQQRDASLRSEDRHQSPGSKI